MLYIVCVCGVCVCGGVAHVFAGVRDSPGVKMMLVRCWFSVPLSSLHNPFKQVSLNLELGWQPASLGNPLCLPPTALGLQLCAGYLSGYWGFELMSSCLHCKCSYPQSHLPGPKYIGFFFKYNLLFCAVLQ